jgi:hypothetical protein
MDNSFTQDQINELVSQLEQIPNTKLISEINANIDSDTNIAIMPHTPNRPNTPKTPKTPNNTPNNTHNNTYNTPNTPNDGQILNNSLSGFIVKCPHCQNDIEIAEINCAIFRHGCMKSDLSQIHPHLSKQECDKLIDMELIYGCGKPFKVVKKEDNLNYEAIKCDYI